MAGCGGGKMIPKYKDGGIVKGQYGSTKNAAPVPVPGQFTPAEIASQNKAKREQEAKNRRYSEMDANMKRGAKYYEESRRNGKQ